MSLTDAKFRIIVSSLLGISGCLCVSSFLIVRYKRIHWKSADAMAVLLCEHEKSCDW
jgi:hypothetical protein